MDENKIKKIVCIVDPIIKALDQKVSDNIITDKTVLEMEEALVVMRNNIQGDKAIQIITHKLPEVIEMDEAKLDTYEIVIALVKARLNQADVTLKAEEAKIRLRLNNGL